MKKIVVTFLAFSSLNALSCPRLKGNYFCPDSAGNVKKLEINQELVTGYTNYIFKEDQAKEGRWIVDGKQRSLDSSPMDGVSNTRYVARCNSQKLMIDMSGDLLDFDTKINYKLTMYRDENKNLVQRSSGSLEDGTPLPEVVTQCFVNGASLRQK